MGKARPAGPSKTSSASCKTRVNPVYLGDLISKLVARQRGQANKLGACAFRAVDNGLEINA